MKTLIVAVYCDGHDVSMMLDGYTKEKVLNSLDNAEEGSWSYVVFHPHQVLSMSGLQEVQIYELS